MEYRGIRYTLRAGIERRHWFVSIHPEGVEVGGKGNVLGTRIDAEDQARRMINRWLGAKSKAKTVVAVAVVGVSLTGCSSALSSNSSSEQLQTLKFESDPLGAEVHSAQGQTCKTPCELKVPSREQSVIITKDDYLTQTFHVTLGPQPDHSFWENPPPTLEPNPVRVVLQPVSKPAALHRNKRPK